MSEGSSNGSTTKLVVKYIEYVFPRNTFAPILMALALENVVSNGLEWYFIEVGPVVGWTIILVISFLVSTLWGIVSGDREQLEMDIEEYR